MTHNGWTDMDDFDAELDRLLAGARPSADAPAWCGDVAVLVRRATAPARPDELAREASIVARMREIRLAIVAGDEPAAVVDEDDDTGAGALGDAKSPESPLTAAPVHARNGSVPRDLAVPWSAAITAEGEITRVAEVPGAEATDTPDDVAAAAASLRRVPDPLAQRLRARVAEQQEVVDLDAYRAKHGGEASYQAKHAAERAADDHRAVVRTVSRVVAIKAVAIATAAAIGVAAAAAATTGIMANVVVPVINENVGKPVTTVPTPTTHHSAPGDATTGARRATTTGESNISDCGTMSLLPTCVPLPPTLVMTVPQDVAAEVTAATADKQTTPTDATTSTTVADTTTTSETTPESTTTSEPAPPTTEAPPDTTVPPSDPGQSFNPLGEP